ECRRDRRELERDERLTYQVDRPAPALFGAIGGAGRASVLQGAQVLRDRIARGSESEEKRLVVRLESERGLQQRPRSTGDCAPHRWTGEHPLLLAGLRKHAIRAFDDLRAFLEDSL